jgi:hypothetical protein
VLAGSQQLFVTPVGHFYYNDAPKIAGDCRVPSLVELIEACGEHFSGLLRRNPWNDGTQPTWIAEANLGGVFETGETPSVALAKLWILLNTNYP